MPTPRKPCKVCGSTDREPHVQRYCSRKCHIAAYSREAPNGCVIWSGAIKDIGYGVITMRNKSYHAHRVAWEVSRGPIPEGRVICHRCDNRACVNPDHMFLGTHLDNSTDMVAKGRSKRGERASWSKLTEAQARQILHDKVTPHATYARELGVSETAISHIRKRRNWKCLDA